VAVSFARLSDPEEKWKMNVKAVVNCRLVDGRGGEPMGNATVVVQDDRIAAVGQAPAPDGAEVIDAAGRVVMPCLMDGHMHVSSMPEGMDARRHVAASLSGLGKLRQCLAWGTATVAHACASAESAALRDAIASGQTGPAARLLVGAAVNATGGHVRGRAADGPWEIRKAVREVILGGADYIKTAASGGFQWAHERVEWEDYTQEELAALVAEAHAKDKRVAVHAHSQPGLNHAINAGCDIILHGAVIDEEALRGIAAKGLWYMPTLFITSRHVVDRPNFPEHTRERMKRAQPIHRQGVRRARELGLKICGGTDGGPGSIMLEMQELVSCGLSAMEAIVACSRNTAEALGVLDHLGTLEPGKKADLLIVNGDPLADIRVLASQDRLSLVMKDGRVCSASEAFRRHLPPPLS